MAYYTKSLVKDINGAPAPQYYNQANDAYEVAQGTSGAVLVSLATALSADYDSVSIKMAKGPSITILNAVTATTTSAEIDCRGYNSILVKVEQSGGTWDISLQGAMVSGATFVDLYNGSTQMKATGLTASRMILWTGVPDFVKVVATLTGGSGSVTVKVQPLNM